MSNRVPSISSRSRDSSIHTITEALKKSRKSRDVRSRIAPAFSIAFHCRLPRALGIGTTGMYIAKRIHKTCTFENFNTSTSVVPEKRTRIDCDSATSTRCAGANGARTPSGPLHCCARKGVICATLIIAKAMAR